MFKVDKTVFEQALTPAEIDGNGDVFAWCPSENDHEVDLIFEDGGKGFQVDFYVPRRWRHETEFITAMAKIVTRVRQSYKNFVERQRAIADQCDSCS